METFKTKGAIMANFDTAIKKILQSEGGYANDPDDEGRETYAGISRRFFPKWEGWKIVDGYKGRIGLRQNQKIPLRSICLKIEDFYEKYFWRPLRCEKIENQSVAESLFDCAVNTGKRPAVRELQRLTNTYIPSAKIEIDGIIGPKTLKAVNYVTNRVPLFSNYLIQARINDYFSKCYDKKVKFKFLRGWIIRSLKMIER
jgi:lysozyme family protein